MPECFDLLEKLGAGGMGTVWKARHRDTGQLVALKLLHEQYATDPEMVTRFEREVEITRRIDSPYVVKMLGYGQLEGRPYACMEYVPGEPLRSVIKRVGPMRWQETQRVLRQVALGLQAAHEAGIIHRDVKPSNILIAPGGVAKLVDFGIARAADMTALTGPATIRGTAAYTAPEGEHSPATDLYALGCTAYEMLAGEQPFIGDSPAQILIKHLRDVPDGLGSLGSPVTSSGGSSRKTRETVWAAPASCWPCWSPPARHRPRRRLLRLHAADGGWHRQGAAYPLAAPDLQTLRRSHSRPYGHPQWAGSLPRKGPSFPGPSPGAESHPRLWTFSFSLPVGPLLRPCWGWRGCGSDLIGLVCSLLA